MSLLTRIRSIFAPPVFADEEKARVARLLNGVLLFFIVATVATMLILAISVWPDLLNFQSLFTLTAEAVMAAVFLGLLILVRRGFLRLPAIVISVLIWAIMTYWVVMVSGVRDGSVMVFALVVAIAGLLLGKRAAVLSMLASTLSLVAAYLFEWFGLTRVEYGPLTVGHLLIPAVALILTGLLLRDAVGSIIDALASARRNESAQREANRELAATRETLEQRTAIAERRSLQLEAAAQVAREAAAIRDVEQLLSQTAQFISERFGYYHTGIFLLDDAGEYAVLRAASSEGGQRMLARGHRLKVGETGIVGWSAGAGQPRIALDVGADVVFFDNPDLPQTRSELALPLKVRGRVIGVLDVQSAEPSAFTAEDTAVLQTMADQLAIAIENARLLQETEDRLREVSVLLARSTEEGWARLTASRPEWRYVYDRVDVRPAAAPVEPQISVPLRVRDEAIGQLGLVLGDRQPGTEEIALAQAIADQASQALESARLFQDTQRALGEMESLYRAIQTISTEFELDPLTDKLVEAACRLLNADYGVLVTLDPATGGMVHFKTAGIAMGECTLPELPQGKGLLKVLLEGQSVRVNDLHEHPAFSGSLPPNHLPISSFLGVPLIYQNQVRGLLAVSNRVTSPTFDQANENLLATFAAQATVAIENARLFEEARRRAERERVVSDASARVRAALDLDLVLQTAAGEMQRALNLEEVEVRLGAGPMSEAAGDNGAA